MEKRVGKVLFWCLWLRTKWANETDLVGGKASKLFPWEHNEAHSTICGQGRADDFSWYDYNNRRGEKHVPKKKKMEQDDLESWITSESFFSQTSSNHVFKGKARFLKHPSFVFFCVSVSSVTVAMKRNKKKNCYFHDIFYLLWNCPRWQ